MALTDKYNSVLEYAKGLGAEVANFHEENGMLVLNATAPTPYVKNAIFDQLKSVSGLSKEAQLTDVAANINVSDESVYHRHTVQKGDTLGKIAKHYYDEASKYMLIFEANRDILKDPNVIFPEQVLQIPFES